MFTGRGSVGIGATKDLESESSVHMNTSGRGGLYWRKPPDVVRKESVARFI